MEVPGKDPYPHPFVYVKQHETYFSSTQESH